MYDIVCFEQRHCQECVDAQTLFKPLDCCVLENATVPADSLASCL